MAQGLGAEPLALTANWDYQSSSEGGSQLVQNYAVALGKRLDLTEKMAVDTAMRYNRRTDAESTRQNAIPSAAFLINNDLFSFNLAGIVDEELTDSESLGDRSNRSVAGHWNSVWGRQVWWLPAVNANFIKNWQGDTLSVHRQDSDLSGAGGSLDWDLALAKVLYRYNTHEENDMVSGRQSTGQDHLTRIETDASFWDGRGAVSLAQQYAHIDNENRVRVEAGIALLPVLISAYYGEAIPSPVTLSLNSALTDGNREVTAVTVNNPVHPMNIAVRMNFKQVDRLYLYTDTALSVATSSQFGWELYTSNNNLDWTLAQAAPVATYNALLKRFEFVVSGHTNEFLKIVAVHDPAITVVNFTEIEAYQALSATDPAVVVRDTQANYQTDANLSLELRPDLRLTSSVTYQQNNSSISADMTTTGVNSGLAWNPNPSWSVRVNGNRSTRDRANLFADENRTYGLSLGFPTIPTVESSIGVSLSEFYEDRKRSTTDTDYTLQFIADLYTDLNARLNLSWNQRNDLVTQLAGQERSVKLNLTARLRPGLIADWSGTYTNSSDHTSSVATDAVVNWRFSERLSLRGGLSGLWGETDSADLSCGFDVALTDTMQVSLSQRRQFAPEVGNITGLDWRWTINDYLSMMAGGAFLYGGVADQWNIFSRLNTRWTSL